MSLLSSWRWTIKHSLHVPHLFLVLCSLFMTNRNVLIRSFPFGGTTIFLMPIKVRFSSPSILFLIVVMKSFSLESCNGRILKMNTSKSSEDFSRVRFYDQSSKNGLIWNAMKSLSVLFCLFWKVTILPPAFPTMNSPTISLIFQRRQVLPPLNL